MTFYLAETDENRVLCVEQVDESGQSEVTVRQLAVAYPGVVYFIVDNRFPETRVPIQQESESDPS